MHAREKSEKNRGFEIFSRVLQSGNSMSSSLARHILTLGFGADDQQRMSELAEKNRDGKLSKAESDELFGYVRAGHMLATLHSKARQSLSRKKTS